MTNAITYIFQISDFNMKSFLSHMKSYVQMYILNDSEPLCDTMFNFTQWNH